MTERDWMAILSVLSALSLGFTLGTMFGVRITRLSIRKANEREQRNRIPLEEQPSRMNRKTPERTADGWLKRPSK